MLLVEYLAFNTFLLATSCHAPPHRMDPDSFIVFLPYPENRTDPNYSNLSNNLEDRF